MLAATLLVSLAGLASWQTMPREEDPAMPHRRALVVTRFPGAGAAMVERLVVEPLEEHLAQMEEIKEVFATARANVAVFSVEIRDEIYDTNSAWDELREVVEEARWEFPEGVGEPEIDDDIFDQQSVVLALTGSADPLELSRAAEDLKRRLLAIRRVSRVVEVGDPGEQITIELDDAAARRLGVSPRQVQAELLRRNSVQPGGSIRLAGRSATLRPATELRSMEEIADTPLMLADGTSLPLGQVARVRRGPLEPAEEIMRLNGEPAVGLALVARTGIDLVDFGQELRGVLAELRPDFVPLEIREVFFQPARVEARLASLSRSLLLGMLVVALVLLLAMGPRLGFLVVLIVPLVTLSSLAALSAVGGGLQQISIAALVIALGMLVDNAIVMAESVQWRLDRGAAPRAASAASVRELAIPLGTATGTTLAAFIPMLLAEGGTADFTRSIPTVILLTLSISYLFAVLVTPVFSEMILRPRRWTSEAAAEGRSRAGRLGRYLAHLALGWPVVILAAAAALLAATLLAVPLVERQFFPSSDREQFVIDLRLPEGTHLDTTDAVTRRLEEALRGHPEVRQVASFSGRSAPHFYYNIVSRPQSPHLAQIVVNSSGVEAVEGLMTWVRDFAGRELVEAEVIPRRLEQGPPVNAPVEIRLFGWDLEDLGRAAEAVLAEVRGVPGTADSRHDLGVGVPTVAFEIDDAAAARRGLARRDVAQTLLGRTRGLPAGQFRRAEDPIPIVVRSSAGEDLPAERLETLDVAAPGGAPVPLGQVARSRLEWRPAAIYHLDRQRMVRVLSELTGGATYSKVLERLGPRLDGLELPAGVTLELGGEGESSAEANTAIFQAMPLGVLLLLFFLLLEFNSFRRIGIILITVPLAVVGVVPGLILSGQPFGFMSLLGVVALVGIVVNNAIVLLDVVETRRAEGKPMEQAVGEAVERRTRPILLTTATTVAGLLPLAFSATTLWPPLAWAIISGLLSSTALTLLVVPALYKLLFQRQARALEAEAVSQLSDSPSMD